jgi:hypothetical protein
MARKKKTQIFSIFGQCERVAAEMMIERYNLHRIDAKDIPPTAAVNDAGRKRALRSSCRPSTGRVRQSTPIARDYHNGDPKATTRPAGRLMRGAASSPTWLRSLR